MDPEEISGQENALSSADTKEEAAVSGEKKDDTAAETTQLFEEPAENAAVADTALQLSEEPGSSAPAEDNAAGVSMQEEVSSGTAQLFEEPAGTAAVADTALQLSEEPGDGSAPSKKGRYYKIAGILLSFAAVLILLISLIVIMKADQVREHYTGPAWYDEYTRSELTLSGNNAFPESLVTKDSAIAERFSYGNRDELYAMDAAACEDSSYYYFADPTDKGSLCRISKKDMSRKTKLCGISAENLNILSGKIYFINHFTAGGDSAGIYSISRDGSGLKQLLEGSFYSLRMVNDWLYYIGGEDGSIRRMNIHGLSEEILCNEDCNDLWVAGNEIYYISQDRERAVSERMVICAMSVDGKDRRELVSRGYYNSLSFHEGILYYSVYNSGYGWIDTAWKEEEPAEGEQPVQNVQAQPPHEGFVELRGLYSPVVYHGGDLWFVDRSDMRSLSVYTPESGRLRHYESENVSSFYLMSDLIVVRWLKDGTKPLVSVNRLNTGEMIDLFGSTTEDQ